MCLILESFRILLHMHVWFSVYHSDIELVNVSTNNPKSINNQCVHFSIADKLIEKLQFGNFGTLIYLTVTLVKKNLADFLSIRTLFHS